MAKRFDLDQNFAAATMMLHKKSTLAYSFKKQSMRVGRRNVSSRNSGNLSKSLTNAHATFTPNSHFLQRQHKFKFKLSEHSDEESDADSCKSIKPFDLNCEVKDLEIKEMKAAFELFKDKDGCISIH